MALLMNSSTFLHLCAELQLCHPSTVHKSRTGIQKLMLCHGAILSVIRRCDKRMNLWDMLCVLYLFFSFHFVPGTSLKTQIYTKNKLMRNHVTLEPIDEIGGGCKQDVLNEPWWWGVVHTRAVVMAGVTQLSLLGKKQYSLNTKKHHNNMYKF